ncbi:uncharacterized protein Eint_101600 [Encephalitozoon intestinalis ATCC 50506]|uniref:Uncharacterized protein n=1 Tax=Encephalitozoon intestinalis (strain ATCC 50506) TaxID=876142 RepID=E0S9V0_ENCIT|nr:uncharacterized protein Eint_101600 [Encephalitozoon intestinalis ATCC 50506]ADM12485.1 hypothetical protein Eint_101600 [Encephalitozoon intestinalis ATCC 50506]UTX46322.1 hypothetical protein GPK93_10g19220 [Encephalitozoon intestinalis]
MIIFPEEKPTKYLNDSFALKMLGAPKYNGKFDFSRKELDIPLAFPFRKTAVKSKSPPQVAFMEKIDNDSVIYSSDGHFFNVLGKYKYSFRIEDTCKRLVTGHQKAFILTEKHMYIYEKKKVSMFSISAIDLSTSSFGEVFVLTSKEILLFDEDGIKKVFPYTGRVNFIHFYLFRELIVVGVKQVFHLNLNNLKVSTIYSTPLRIQLTILKDRLYIQEGTSKGFRVTSLNIEDRTAESIFLEDFMKISVGKSMLALYKRGGEFLFCDRFDLINSKTVVYEVENLIGFFFVEEKSYFFFKEKFVMWNKGCVKEIKIGLEKNRNYLVKFPDNLEMLKEVYETRQTPKGVFRPGKVVSTLYEIIKQITEKEDESVKSMPKKKIKYSEKNLGGF